MDYFGNTGEYSDNQKPIGNVIIDLKRLANLADPPISLAEAKTQLRVTFSDDDAEITALILKATRFVENYCNISIIYQRIQLVAQLCEEYVLPYGPIIGIESVQSSVSDTGSGPVNYETSTANWRADGDLYDPAGSYRQRIIYTAGDFCPDDLKDVILSVLTYLYENRGKGVSKEDLLSILVKAQHYQVKAWI